MVTRWADSLAALRNSHDLRLSSWGPYSLSYLGISHVPDMAAGIRFDFSCFAGQYRRTAVVPVAKRDIGVYPWEAAPDLSYYRFRHELIWKDRLYCDVDYCRLDEESVLICAHLVNNTWLTQPLALQYAASLNFPPLRPQATEILKPCRVVLPEGALWIDALDYVDIHFSKPDHRADLVYDGHLRGEMRLHHFVGGTALGRGFGAGRGDWVAYRLAVPADIKDAVLVFRYLMAPGQTLKMYLSGLLDLEREVHFGSGAGVAGEVTGPVAATLAGEKTVTQTGEEPVTLVVAIGEVKRGTYDLRLTSAGGADIMLDGMALLSQAVGKDLAFPHVNWNPVPEFLPGPAPHSLILRYEHVDAVYGIAWENQPFEVRHIYDDSLEPWAHRMCIGALHQLNPTFRGNGFGHFTNICLRPIILAPGTTSTVYGLLCTGEPDEVRRRLAEFAPALSHAPTPDHFPARQRLRLINEKARSRKVDLRSNPAGEAYLFSQERMAATTLTNAIYPVRTRGRYIKHYTPGRFYETLYTWDAGFIGLGLCELDPERALDILNAYLTPPGESGAAFIHHGTPLPTQFYLFWELWNRTGSGELAAYYYPRLQQYHRFLVGRYGSSTTNNLKSHLLRTWDYFYNSGGWDDYPPQAHVHAARLTGRVAPAVNTAHAIRTAKMLHTLAAALGLDGGEYEEDIEQFTAALQKWSWDEESGYYSYVCHDAAGRPCSILRHESGVNFNMGLDGVTPLIADICTAEQEKRLIEHIMSAEGLWTPYGISTVDRRAPYYRDDGYWNGSVWFPHQWFIWKAFLDCGRGDEAARIAATALATWQREVGEAYACFEHINVKTGRGGGWHHFSGLSTPVLCWYSAYHRPGRLTGGHNLRIETCTVAADYSRLKARLSIYGQPRHKPVAIVTLKPAASSYQVTIDDVPTPYLERYPGTLEVQLPAEARGKTLLVKAYC